MGVSRDGGNPINRCTSAATELLGLGRWRSEDWWDGVGVDLRV